MRLPLLIVGIASLLALPAGAQDKSSDHDRDGRADCPSVAPRVMRTFSFRMRDENRAALGLATTSGGTRDTLGLLVTDVTSGGPAEKAGIEEGDRLQAVNGTDLRLSPADAGDREMRGLMSRRLVRMLEKVKPGDPVELRVYSDGKVHAVKVTTAKASELFKDTGMLHLGSDALSDVGVLDLGNLKQRLEDAGHQLDGLRYEFAPEDPPVPPTPPSPPSPPEIHRHFMRMSAPRALTAPPAPPAPPVPPASPASDSRVSI
jgi:PDZ domain-containing protein